MATDEVTADNLFDRFPNLPNTRTKEQQAERISTWMAGKAARDAAVEQKRQAAVDRTAALFPRKAPPAPPAQPPKA